MIALTTPAPSLSAITTPVHASSAAAFLGLVPRSPRLPSDITMLASVDPMSLTLATVGGLQMVLDARAAAIGDMIRDALRADVRDGR